MINEKEHIDLNLIVRVLAGESSKEEQELLSRWKNESEGNLKLFNEHKQAWDLLDKTTPDKNIDLKKEWLYHQQHYMQLSNTKTFSLYPVLAYAASILIIIGISYFGWMFFSKHTIESEIAKTQEVTLPDGSFVTLNAGSKLSYTTSFGKNDRMVNLQGEAYFKVAKDPKKPFIINAHGAEIKVLGTSFNVKAYNESSKIEVTVAEGIVSLYEKNNEEHKILITKGEKAVFDNQLLTTSKQNNDNINFDAWKTKQITFNNDSLTQVLKTVSEVYHIPIKLTNPDLEHCSITTTFDNNDLSTVLKILKSTLNIKFELKDNIIYVYGKGCK